ncbi:MAG: IS110 family transposase [Mycobacterium sp.]|uniref:IS110 family transposase n=1 Tax=Mycobacterium sp. TaxID=1785 RepID=UPI003F98D957
MDDGRRLLPSKGGRRKNDRIDAAAAACVAALQRDARPSASRDTPLSLSLLSERRNSLSGRRTRTVNQLHTLLRELVPSGARVDLSVPTLAPALAIANTTAAPIPLLPPVTMATLPVRRSFFVVVA